MWGASKALEKCGLGEYQCNSPFACKQQTCILAAIQKENCPAINLYDYFCVVRQHSGFLSLPLGRTILTSIFSSQVVLVRLLWAWNWTLEGMLSCHLNAVSSSIGRITTSYLPEFLLQRIQCLILQSLFHHIYAAGTWKQIASALLQAAYIETLHICCKLYNLQFY